MTRQAITALEVAQLRVLVDALDGVAADAAVALVFLDGVLHARVDHPDDQRTRRWLAVTEDGAVLRGVAAVLLRLNDLDAVDLDAVDRGGDR